MPAVVDTIFDRLFEGVPLTPAQESQACDLLVRLQLQDGKVVGEEWLLQDRGRRIRDVKQGPDGAVYVVTEAADGELLRIARKS